MVMGQFGGLSLGDIVTGHGQPDGKETARSLRTPPHVNKRVTGECDGSESGDLEEVLTDLIQKNHEALQQMVNEMRSYQIGMDRRMDNLEQEMISLRNMISSSVGHGSQSQSMYQSGPTVTRVVCPQETVPLADVRVVSGCPQTTSVKSLDVPGQSIGMTLDARTNQPPIDYKVLLAAKSILPVFRGKEDDPEDWWEQFELAAGQLGQNTRVALLRHALKADAKTWLRMVLTSRMELSMANLKRRFMQEFGMSRAERERKARGCVQRLNDRASHYINKKLCLMHQIGRSMDREETLDWLMEGVHQAYKEHMEQWFPSIMDQSDDKKALQFFKVQLAIAIKQQRRRTGQEFPDNQSVDQDGRKRRWTTSRLNHRPTREWSYDQLERSPSCASQEAEMVRPNQCMLCLSTGHRMAHCPFLFEAREMAMELSVANQTRVKQVRTGQQATPRQYEQNDVDGER